MLHMRLEDVMWGGGEHGKTFLKYLPLTLGCGTDHYGNVIQVINIAKRLHCFKMARSF